MSRRFKTSKYKNAAPKLSKHEPWVRDLTVGSYNCSGSYIQASAAFLAFNTQLTGSQLGVVPLNGDASINGTNLPILNAHSDLVTDFQFSPFEDGLLVTGSADSTVKVWSIKPESLQDLSTLSPECVMSSKMRRVETVEFNPVADFLVCYTSQNAVTLWDILYNKEIYHEDSIHRDTIMTMNWSRNGTLLVTGAKDKQVRVIDPRGQGVVASAVNHDNSKDSRAIWVGDQHILTTGFDSSRIRQVFIRDVRNFSTPAKTLNFDSSTGIFLPLYDPDTNMLFLAGRGDTSISYMEFTDSEPFLSEGYRYNGEQTKGACLLPKRAIKVMETEVNRVMQLTSSAIIPVPYHVPRKTYLEFHGDLYPDTRGTVTSGTASLWMGGFNGAVTKISLNPASQSNTSNVFKPSLSSRRKEEEAKISRMIEPDPSIYKKDVPEPRPRKKSLTSGSSFEEADGVPPPVPRPRINNVSTPTGGSVLRTPSSFLSSRRQSNEYSRSTSHDYADGDYGASEATHKDPEQTKNGSDHDDMHPNGHANGHSTNGHHQNGNSSTEPTKEAELPEASQGDMEAQQPGPQRDSSEENIPEPKVSVMDRLKAFQEKSNPPEMAKEDVIKTQQVKRQMSYEKPAPEKPARQVSTKAENVAKQPEVVQAPMKVPAKRIDTVFGQVSKYRNFKAAPLHKKFHIENLRNISTTCPGESELIQANPERVAVPLNTPGGKIAIFELDKPGRQPDGVTPGLVHGTKIYSFMWDPFDNYRLVSATDDGRLWSWRIPHGGLTEQTNEAEWSVAAHAEKIFFVKFHPLAQNVLATGSYDMSVRIWNLATQQDVIVIHLSVHLFAFAWSPCGSKFATACKDGKIRLYEPRQNTEAQVEGKGPVGVRGGRVAWVLDGKFLIVAGFDRSSERQLHMYNTATMENVATVSLDVSPAILVPFYDEDSSILFLTGRGDSTIFAFDVMSYAPHLRPLSHHRCPGPHQGLAFLTKNACDVQTVEFARAMRLTEFAVEVWSFTVPRVKSDFFQDDLFPPTKVLWKPAMTSSEWFQGIDKEPLRVSLKPSNMKSLTDMSGSSAVANEPDVVKPTSKYESNKHSIHQLIDKDDVKSSQRKVEQALREKFDLNFDVRSDVISDEDADWH